MIRFIIKNNNIEIFDIYDKFVKKYENNSLQPDISNNTINDNVLSNLSYETDSDYSEMYISEDDFEYIDISKSQPVLKEGEREKTKKEQDKKIKQSNKEKGNNKEEKAGSQEEPQIIKKDEINNETGIIKKSFYKLGNYLFNV